MLFTLSPGQPVADFLPPILMTVGIVILGWLLLATIRGKISRQQEQRQSPRDQIDTIKSSRHLNPAEEHAAGLVTVAQRLASQLDVKAARLEQLIELADERIALISAELAETSEHDGIPSHEPKRYAVSVAPPVEVAPTGSAARSGIRSHGGTTTGNGAADPLSRAVFDLADEGLSPVEIARKLNEHTGKIELMLAMRPDPERAATSS